MKNSNQIQSPYYCVFNKAYASYVLPVLCRVYTCSLKQGFRFEKENIPGA